MVGTEEQSGMSPKSQFQNVNIMGTDVKALDVSGLIELIRSWSVQDLQRTILYVNAHCLNEANKNKHYLEILKDADLVYADGIGAVLAAYLLQGKKIDKITSRDWLDGFCQMSIKDKLRIYLLGGKPQTVQKSRARLENRFPGIRIAGVNDGYFEEKCELEVLAEIKNARPHVLFVGMGTPKQEIWIANNRRNITAPVCWAVGAMFDVLAGSEPSVPKWINAIWLEWFWRLLMNPADKWKRYLFGNPEFLVRLLRQVASERLLMKPGRK
ncbi:MAG: WecB/TagA/CpsF family glycosyltransferase [Anaerolineales bacterium]|nr:WecB/TagA/CpsF family glycosyltransferase [Anaerolineales bacterium]